MNRTDQLAGLLERILSLPTAPFHEDFVSAFVCDESRALGLEPQRDGYGNVLVRYGAPAEVRMAWVAHMDHPGFEIMTAHAGQAGARWYGGVDAKFFVGARVVVYDNRTGGIRARGRIDTIELNDRGRVDKMAVRLDAAVEAGDFGAWDMVPYRRTGDLISTKAADDLVGCAVMLAALAEARATSLETGFLAIFSRAEEVGFIGTLGVIANRVVTPSIPLISIETSKAVPGVRLGGGPVIRLGDRTTMFHYQTILFMDHAARELQSRNGGFSYQRRVMDGGTCEATPFQVSGYAAGGIAIPLRNYHNQGRTKVMPEGIHLKDAAGALALLSEMLSRVDEWQSPLEEIRRRWEKGWCELSGRLQSSSRP